MQDYSMLKFMGLIIFGLGLILSMNGAIATIIAVLILILGVVGAGYQHSLAMH